MFDIKLMKSKFYTKSKSAITATKTRITRIKRKRKAMQKYLKNDIADLLKNGLDLNAYGRVEGLWNELNLSSCYEFVEQFCTQISTHLTNMDKQRDCPDVCREAVSSLMLAAARFSDLPELRVLGNVFLQRFGTSLDYYVNKEFNNKIKSMTPPTKDMKLQVMQEIAKQSGVEWNAKNLEQKLFNPPPPAIIVKDGNNPDMMDAVQTMDKKDADYDEARKKGYLYKDGRTELSRDERVVVPKVESFGGCNKNQEGSSPPAKDNNNQDHKPSNLRRTSSGEEEEEEEVVDMEPFYYKTIRLPSYKSNLKQDTNLIQQCDDSITEHTVTRPKPKSVRTRNQKASPAATVIISVTRKSESVLETFLQQTDRSNEGVRFEKDGVKNGPPTRRASLPAESRAVETTKKECST